MVVLPPNLPGWVDIPLADRVQRQLGLPTFLERDTNVAMMAEWRYGSARNADDAIYITVSTGIGGGIIARGEPLQGPTTRPARSGTSPSTWTGRFAGTACRATPRPSAPAPPSPETVGRCWNAANRRSWRSARRGRWGGGCRDGCRSRRVRGRGQPRVYERAYVAVGVLCASLVNALNPQVIVIGGSIAEHHPELREVARMEIDSRAFPGPARRVRVTSPRFTDDVSLIGSLPLVNERMDDPAYRRTPDMIRSSPRAANGALGMSPDYSQSDERVGAHTQLEEPR